MDASETPSPTAIVRQMVMGSWVAKTVAELTRLDVPDVLAAHGPCTAEEMVARHRVPAEPASLARALRAGAALGLFTEDADGRFGPTPLSEVLTAASPTSVKALAESAGGTWFRIWQGLGDAIRTGAHQAKAQLGLDFWDFLDANPTEMETFAEAMRSNSLASQQGVLERADLSRFGTVVDVGGGFGHLALALLEKYPALRAVVLDMARLVPMATARLAEVPTGVRERISFVGGDMFASVPAGDAYVLKHIIHDWDDERCARLLRNCVTAMQGDGRIFCIDAVLAPLGDTGGLPAKLLDLNMLVSIPGEERTQARWESLYAAAGLEIESITPLGDPFGTSIIVGKKA